MSQLPPEQNKEIDLQKILMNPVERKRILDTLRKNKPRHWSSRSNSPYYNLGTATEMQFILDRMMRTRIDELYEFKRFPQYKRTTLYAKINQGVKFLLDHMDQDGKYATFWQCVYCHTIFGVGIKLEVRHDLLQDMSDRIIQDNLPTQLINNQSLSWKDTMEEFLEKGECNKAFVLQGLCLSTEEVHDLEMRFLPLESVIAKISNSEIKLIKTA